MYRLCNRCGDEYRPTYGGKIEMNGKDPSYTGRLCPDCYDEIMDVVMEVQEE